MWYFHTYMSLYMFLFTPIPYFNVYVCLCTYVQRPDVNLSCSLPHTLQHVFWEDLSDLVKSSFSDSKRRINVWITISALCHHPKEITSPYGLLRVSSDKKRLGRYPFLLLEISYLRLSKITYLFMVCLFSCLSLF